MSESGKPDTNSGRLNPVLAEYLRRRERGEAVDVESLCQAHPDLADALRSYAAGEGLIEAFAGDSDPSQVDSSAARNAETLRPGAAQRTDLPGERKFGKYQILRTLGEGAMGAIYLASDTNLDREVALKIPKFKGAEGADFRQRFSREARAAAKLDHPGICRVYDADEIDGTPYISMAFLDGQPLSRFVGTPEFQDQRRVAEVVRDIASALAHAHQQGVLHRDLKPGNVMMLASGAACVTDFGLARHVNAGEESRLTHEGTILGTPAYMSPEQIEGDPNRIGPATDIYALGVILYELLASRLPFTGSVMAILGKALRDRPIPLCKLRGEVHSELEDLCLQMLEKTPDKRPASMQEVADRLDTWLQHTSPEAQATEAKVQKNVETLESMKGKILDLVQRGQFAAAVSGLEKMVQVKLPEARDYVRWARDKLKEVKQAPKQLRAGVPALVATAQQCFARHDYAQAGQLLQDIPEDFRTDEARQLLDQCIELQDEADLLLADLQDCVKRKQFQGIESNLKRLLELKPGNKFAKDLHESLQTYSKVPWKQRKYRYDDRGRLLPKQSALADNWLVWSVACFALVFGAAYFGITIYLQDDSQTVKVEVDPTWLAELGGNATLVVDGDKELSLTGTDEDLTVTLGDHGFTVRRGDTVVHSPQTFTIEREGRQVLRIDHSGMTLAAASSSSDGEPGDGEGGSTAGTGSDDSGSNATTAANLKQILLALRNYHDTHGKFPARCSVDSANSNRPLLSWRVHLLPFLGEQDLYARFRLDEPWDSPHNRALAASMPAVYHSDGLAPERTSIVAPVTAQGTPNNAVSVFPYDAASEMRDIRDGTSNTLMLLRVAPPRAPIWTSPEDWIVNAVNAPLQFEIRANGTTALAIADGRVLDLPSSALADTEFVRAIVTRAGGESFDWNKATQSTAAKPTADDGWTDLFNGRDLSGWKSAVNNDWSVANGSLVSDAGPRGVLWTEQNYADFEMDFEFKLSRGANSGVFLRYPSNTDGLPRGLEVQLLDDPNHPFNPGETRYVTGSLHGLAVPRVENYRTAQWNRMTIRNLGRTVTVTLNGQAVLSENTTQLTVPDDRRDAVHRNFGYIGLQTYGAGTDGQKKIEFRNMRIRRLNFGGDPVSTTSTPASATANTALPTTPPVPRIVPRTERRYVNAAAPSQGAGRSWADAYQDLQTALEQARPSDSGVKEIWIAKGTYLPAAASGPRTATFQLIDGVSLYGGFDGRETQLAQRNVVQNRTILSGDLKGDSDGVMGHNLNKWEDNVYHVVTGSNLGPATLLDGFQIEHGVANSVKEGGGLRLTNASPVVRNCLFTLNWGERRGGAVDSVDGSPRFEDSTFVNNFTVQRGAISSRGKRDGTSTPLLFLRCMIRDNRSQPAGGGFCIDSGRNVVAINCTLMNNSHSFWEPGKDVQYGGGAVNVIGSAFTAINCLFVNNRADGYGSAVHSMSGSVQLSNCTIYGGSAKRGSEPAVFATGKVRVRVQNSIIWPDDARDVFEMKDGATLDISHCCVRGAKDLPDVTPLGPRIDGAANGDFRLGEQSKCIDAGKAEYLPPDQFDIDGDGNTSEPLPLDLNGKPRVVGKGVDFGALEYQP